MNQPTKAAMETQIIQTGFEAAFSLRMPDGKLRRFGCCNWHDDKASGIVSIGGKFWLVNYDSRDNGFKELSREELPVETLVTDGYHDSEHGEWQTVAAMFAKTNNPNADTKQAFPAGRWT